MTNICLNLCVDVQPLLSNLTTTTPDAGWLLSLRCCSITSSHWWELFKVTQLPRSTWNIKVITVLFETRYYLWFQLAEVWWPPCVPLDVGSDIERGSRSLPWIRLPLRAIFQYNPKSCPHPHPKSKPMIGFHLGELGNEFQPKQKWLSKRINSWLPCRYLAIVSSFCLLVQ